MLVAAMVGLDARSTMDLDATVKGANVNVEDVYKRQVMKMYKKYRSVKGDFGADYKTKSGTKRCELDVYKRQRRSFPNCCAPARATGRSPCG